MTDRLESMSLLLLVVEVGSLSAAAKKLRVPLATVSRKVAVCRQFFAEAVDRRLIEVNPAARLRGFTVSQESKTMGLSKGQAKAQFGGGPAEFGPQRLLGFVSDGLDRRRQRLARA